jgi:hypothetical protein
VTRTGQVFIGIVWAIGLVTGLVLAREPDALPVPTPAILVPLAVGLLVDLAVRPAAERGRMPPLTMNERATGVIGGAFVAVGVTVLFASG